MVCYDHIQDNTIPDHYQQVFVISKMGLTPKGNILKLSKMYMIKQHQLSHEPQGFHSDVVGDSILLAYDNASLCNWFQKF